MPPRPGPVNRSLCRKTVPVIGASKHPIRAPLGVARPVVAAPPAGPAGRQPVRQPFLCLSLVYLRVRTIFCHLHVHAALTGAQLRAYPREAAATSARGTGGQNDSPEHIVTDGEVP